MAQRARKVDLSLFTGALVTSLITVPSMDAVPVASSAER